MKLFYVLILVFAAIFCTSPARALDIGTPVSAYRHDVFDARSGAPRNAITLAQTADGWLWFGTPSGLVRYDGTSYQPFQPAAGERLLGQYITGLMAHPNGDLWIGYLYGGISVLRGGHLTHLQPFPGQPIGSAASFAVDGDSVWVAASTGVFRYQAGQWQRFGAEQGLSAMTRHVFRDPYGRLWAADARHVYALDRASGRFAPVLDVAAEPILTTSPDGRVWATDGENVQLLPPPAQGWQALAPAPVRASSQQTLFDRDGNYWTGNCPVGVCVLRPGQPGQEPAGFRDLTAAGVRNDGQIGRAGTTVTAVMEDREGSLWFATTDGVERLRDTRMVPVPLPQQAGWPAMALDGDGAMWISSTNMGLNGRLWKMAAGQPVLQRTGQDSALVARGRDGTVLVAGGRWIERRRGERVLARYPMPPGDDKLQVRDVALLLAEDRDGIWLYYSGKGLLRLRGGHWQPAPHDAGLARAIYAFVDPAGRAWFGTRVNGVIMIDGGRRRVYGAADGIALGAVTFVDAGHELVISGDGGTALWQGGRFRPLRADGVDLANVSGLVATADGDRWLNTQRGLFHVSAADWRRSVADPAYLLRGALLDELDGFPGSGYGVSPVPTLQLDGDGRLWVSGTDGVAVLDRERDRARRSAAPLFAEVSGLDADGRRLAGDLAHVLAPRVERLRFDFTAPALGLPERVRFRYRLDGFDHDWIDAGALRSATYTNPGPGSYRFEVQALNEDGVAGPVAAMPTLQIQPAFTQTPLFLALCALATVLTAWWLYRWKLRRVQRAWQGRMEARLGERERIARTLHDTFLQSLQGLILQLDAMTGRLAPGSPERLRMEALLASARRVTVEGRNQVQDLRDERAPASLEAAIAASLVELNTDSGVAVSLCQNGTPRPLAPEQQQEVEAIAREAIANVFQHAQARRLDITLDWDGAGLALRIVDDGVGIDPAVLEQGRPGHYGLRGMRERAARLGAALALGNGAGGGMELVLTLD